MAPARATAEAVIIPSPPPCELPAGPESIQQMMETVPTTDISPAMIIGARSLCRFFLWVRICVSNPWLPGVDTSAPRVLAALKPSYLP